MRFVKLKDDVDFSELIKYGFVEDPANCEHPEDTYYHLNNYYLQIGNNFRITVSTIDRGIDILCLSEGQGLYVICDLKPLYELFTSGLIEIK